MAQLQSVFPGCARYTDSQSAILRCPSRTLEVVSPCLCPPGGMLISSDCRAAREMDQVAQCYALGSLYTLQCNEKDPYVQRNEFLICSGQISHQQHKQSKETMSKFNSLILNHWHFIWVNLENKMYLWMQNGGVCVEVLLGYV